MIADSDGFTPREREVLALAASGLTNAQMAAELGITRNAVRFHLKEIHSKLETEGDRQLLRSGWLQPIMSRLPFGGYEGGFPAW